MLNNKKLKELKDVKIAVSGKSGCGNTTVSRLLADTLELRFINFTFRSLAQEKGMDFKEVLALAAEDDSWDREVDTRQVDLAREEGGCVLGSRLAIWMLPEADLKVVLSASFETRAKRIQSREGGNIEEIAAFTADRDRQDRERYMRIYQIDNDNYSFADMVIDTDNTGPRQIADKIIAEVKRKITY
ncbi:MAG: AAA family ATPase [Treponema sp.]|nr:AAA family ATPase [Treponema sp.]